MHKKRVESFNLDHDLYVKNIAEVTTKNMGISRRLFLFIQKNMFQMFMENNL